MRIEELPGLALFEGLRHEHLELLAPLFRPARFAADQEIFAAGDPAQELYLVESGEVVIRLVPEDGGCLEVARIQPGSIFGWSAALGRPSYTASAVCLADTQALAIQGSDLRQAMRSDSELGNLLLERMAQIAAHRSAGLRDQLMKLFQTDVNQP